MDVRAFIRALERISKILMPVSGDGPIVLLFFVQIIFLVVGFVRLMLPDYRKHGLITIGNSLLYALGIFLIDNGYMPIIGILIFAAAAITLGILNATVGHYSDKKEVTVSLIVYAILVAIVIALLFFLSNKSGAAFLSDITLLQWEYGVLLACFGIRLLHVGQFILYFFIAGVTLGPPPTSDDPIAGATGKEQSVDTVSMSE